MTQRFGLKLPLIAFCCLELCSKLDKTYKKGYKKSFFVSIYLQFHFYVVHNVGEAKRSICIKFCLRFSVFFSST